MKSSMNTWMGTIAAVIFWNPAQATLILDDFSYANNATLLGQSGGSGWTGSWGPSTGTGANTSRILADAGANLSYSTGGYAIAQTGSGRAFTDFNAFRGITRTADTDLVGTVWFSLLIEPIATTTQLGLEWNTHPDSPTAVSAYNRGAFDVGYHAGQLEVRYGGVVTSGLAALASNQTHLLLGRITMEDNGTNDRLQVWADPADLSNPGTALFDQNSANMGTAIYLAGIFGYGSTNTSGLPNGYADALRFSDGPNAYFDVTGVTLVPEPTSAVLIGLGMLLLLRRGRPER